MMLSLAKLSINSSEISWSFSDTCPDILPNSREYSPELIDFPFTDKILLLEKALPSPKKPPNVATNPKIIIPTIIEEPDELRLFLMFDNAD